MLAVAVVAATVLAGVKGLRRLDDEGFRSGETAPLDRAVFILIGVVLVLAVSTYCRFYLVSWIGERVVADLRRGVFDRVITLNLSYFETRRTGDILSRLTADTTLLQTVIGSSLSQALRNAMMLAGGLSLPFLTHRKRTPLCPLVLPPLLPPPLVSGARVCPLHPTTPD